MICIKSRQHLSDELHGKTSALGQAGLMGHLTTGCMPCTYLQINAKNTKGSSKSAHDIGLWRIYITDMGRL